MDITLRYYGGEKTFSALAIRGYDDVDDVVFWPAIDREDLQGSINQKNIAFQRIITVYLDVVQIKADRVFLKDYLTSNDMGIITIYVPFYTVDNEPVYDSDGRPIVFALEELKVEHENPREMMNVWLDNVDIARSYTLRFIERQPLTSVPASWLN